MAALDRAALVKRLRQVLLDSANPSGGWGYYAAKSSRIEPTCWALLALAESEADSAADSAALPPSLTSHMRYLMSCQRTDGLLLERDPSPPNFTANGIAACLFARFPNSERDAIFTRLLDGLIAVKGVAINDPDPRQNSTLQAWPWVPDTFSWAEPTAFCLLALKRARRLNRTGANDRIAEADRLLVNRAVTTGGWNYGNGSALGQDLRPYVPTTAVVLLALQDRRDEPAVKRSASYLERARLDEPSAMALGLAAIALRTYGLDSADVEDRLANDMERAERVGNILSLAIALYGLTAARHLVRAFRVSSS